jgi:hypothetical protein
MFGVVLDLEWELEIRYVALAHHVRERFRRIQLSGRPLRFADPANPLVRSRIVLYGALPWE